MDLKIIIGDDELEIPANQVVAITKQAAKVGDFSKVLADGTNMITVAQTARNKAIMQNAHIMQNNSGLPYTRMTAKLIQEGIETIQDGFAILESVNGNYQLQLIGGNASFFFLIKDKNIRDLDWSIFDHFWTNQNVFDNRNNTDGFVYALFEQSDQSTQPTLSTYGVNLYAVQTEFLLPCFYVKTIMEAIFLEAGYTFQSDITAMNMYDKLAIFQTSALNRGSDMSYLNFTIYLPSDYTLPGPYGIIGFADLFADTALIQEQVLNFWNNSPLPYNTIFGHGYYLIPDNGVVTLEFEITFNNTISDGQIVDLILENTSPDGIQTQIVTWTLPLGISTQTATLTAECSQLSTRPECGYGLSLNGYVDVVSGSTVSASFEFKSNIGISLNEGYFQTLPFNYLRGLTCVPDISQVDFIKEVAKIFQLVFNTDTINGIVTAKRFDEIRDNIPNAVDLSGNYHDDDKSTQMSFAIPGYAQRNLMKWKEDDITKYTGEGIIFCNNETIDYEKTTIQMSKFAATSPVGRFDTKQVPYIPLFNENRLPENGITDRLLILKPETFPYNINFNRSTEIPTDHPTFDVTFAFFLEAGNNDSLDFPTIAERFYQTIISMLQSPKILNGQFKIRISDVYNYDPFLPVYIQKFNEYFYWEKLDNYVKNKKTKLTLIRL